MRLALWPYTSTQEKTLTLVASGPRSRTGASRTRHAAKVRAMSRRGAEGSARRRRVYQGFSLLTANQRELEGKPFRTIVARTKLTPAQVVFAFARRVGMLPLTGTSDPAHMREDLAVAPSAITDADVKAIESLSG